MPNPTDKAVLVISRDSEDDIGFRGLDIYLDADHLVNLDNGKSISVEIEPGHHSLRATNSLYAQKAEFDAKPGESVKYQVVNVMTGLGKITMTLGAAIYKVRLTRLTG